MKDTKQCTDQRKRTKGQAAFLVFNTTFNNISVISWG